jgi:hypothetical protein
LISASTGGVTWAGGAEWSDHDEYRTCPLCEATCGLAITTRDREITSIRGDDDVFSHGFSARRPTR